MPEAHSPQELAAWAQAAHAQRARYTRTIIACAGTGCQAGGGPAMLAALRQELGRRGLENQVQLRPTGCHGFCEQGPLLIVEPDNILYCHVKPEDAAEVIERTLVQGQVVERLLYTDPVSGKRLTREAEIPFYRAQERVLLNQNKLVDPCEIEDYVAIGGYSALAQALTSLPPEGVIAEVRAAGLRGRGGGGFPTAVKWETSRRAPGQPKVVICNADEGDPGAYMNRSVLEGNPHAVIEGMLIGAYAIGATQGFIYVRTEYPLAVERVRIAVDQARAAGLLGENILGSGLGFDIQVARGAGAFVAGESTALMTALEGQVSEPRPKDVHTAVEGYKGLPSTLNNVETWANVPLIIHRGAAWFAGRGATKSPGTKIFALTGQIKNTGLVEVPLGTPLKTVLYDIGGGPTNGQGIKAVQIGGPSGGCIPATLFDLPAEFDALLEAGAMLGSGGMVVLDEGSCMVDVARYFLEFLQDESCGKCVPCRLGVGRMLEIVNDIAQGRGRPEQLDLLQDLGETMAQASLCALGKTAPNPVLTTLRYFRSEYEAHILEQRCPAGVCRALIRLSIAADKCTACGACQSVCPVNAISGTRREKRAIDQELCTRCGACKQECHFDAIRVQ